MDYKKILKKNFKNKKVVVTGHTGFKGILVIFIGFPCLAQK